jgi:ribonucleotide reductase beta subunit family protein with ferritin-like domain
MMSSTTTTTTPITMENVAMFDLIEDENVVTDGGVITDSELIKKPLQYVKPDPILTPNKNRHTMFPISDNEIWELYKKQQQSFWRCEEINLAQDLKDWEKLTDNERYFIKMVLAFFSSSDGIVAENLVARFSDEVQLPEARAFYGFQNMMENIHSEMYSLLIDTYVKDEKEKDKLFHAVDNFPCIKEKADWAKQWINNKKATFAIRLFAFSIVEGVFFSSSFASIYWIKKRGLMHGLTMSNEFISRDEAQHTNFAILLLSKINEKIPQKKAYKIMREAVAIEQNFITESIPCRLIGMNSDLMNQYIEYVADHHLVQCGYEKLYNKTNPFPFMEMISLDGKTNFFEAQVSEYSLASKNNGKENLSFDDDVDF